MKNDDNNKFMKLHSLFEPQQQILHNIKRDTLNQLSNIVSKHSVLNNVVTNSELTHVINAGIAEYSSSSQGVNSLNSILNEDITKQFSELLYIVQTKRTPMIEGVRAGLLGNNIEEYINALNKGLSQSVLETSDIFYLKRSNIISDINDHLDLPYGFKSVLDNLNVSSVNRLVNQDDISFDMKERVFFNENTEENTVNVSEINTICSVAEILEKTNDKNNIVDESDLIDFLTYLKDTPMLGMEHDIGKKIRNTISEWQRMNGFDCDKFYHARARESQSCPFTYQDLLAVPNGTAGPGRFNHNGQSHYYFSDLAEGAVTEIKKYAKEKTIQTVEIVPTQFARSIPLVDLSNTLRKGNVFLKYLRFPVNDTESIMPREYLIPCFVSDCCQRCGIEGIKYYGGAKYSNYVTWHSGHFKYSRMMSDC